MSGQHSQPEVVIACDLTAIPIGQREQHAADAAAIFASVQEVRDLSDGYAFRVLGDSATLSKLAEFITFERLCCPFFAFGVDVEPQCGAIWLRLSGAEGVKQFVAAEIGGSLNEAVARAAGFRQATS